MTITEEDITEFLMIFCCGSTAAIEENAGVRCAGVGIHSGKVMIGKPQSVNVVSKDLIKPNICLIDSALCACRGANIHFHIREDSIYNQRRQSLRRFFACIAIPGGEDHVIGEVGVELEGKSNLLLIGGAGDSASLFAG